MVMADKEIVDVVRDIDLEVDENEQHQHHQCNHSNILTSQHDGCPINEPHYHPWDQEAIVYVPMIPFGDTSTRAGACIQVTGLQPVAPPAFELPSTANQANEEGDQAATVKIEGDIAAGPNQQESPLNPTVSTRELHNEIERKRRLRIKQCCDILRRLIPGLNEKTDKATVLEHTVDYVDHLFKCPNHKCVCYQQEK